MAVIGNEMSGREDRRERRLELANLVGAEDIHPQSGGALQLDAKAIVLQPFLGPIDEELAGLVKEVLEPGVPKQRTKGLEGRHVEAAERLRDALDPVAPSGAQELDEPGQHMGQVGDRKRGV